MDEVLKAMNAVLLDYFDHGLLAMNLLQRGDFDAADQVLCQRTLLFDEFNLRADEALRSGIDFSADPGLRQLWGRIKDQDGSLKVALKESCDALSREALLLNKGRRTIQSYKSGHEDDSIFNRRV